MVARGGGGGKKRIWCGCYDNPAPEPPKPARPMAQEHAVNYHQSTYFLASRAPTLNDVASITLMFHKPIEEPFDTKSPRMK